MNFGITNLVLLVILELVLVEIMDGKSISKHYADIVKRHLRWNANKWLVSEGNTVTDMHIQYLKPHEKSVPISNTNDIYMAFTLYMRNGSYTFGTGVFHVIDLATVKSYPCGTHHSKAYYHFYEFCAENDKDIVASGWCWGGSRGLVFNSNTFNSAGRSYMDGRFYLNDGRTVNSIEQQLLTSCYNSWKNNKFNVNWVCPTANITLSATKTFGPRDKRSADGCDSCDCLHVTSKGSPSVKGVWHKYWTLVLLLPILLLLHIGTSL